MSGPLSTYLLLAEDAADHSHRDTELVLVMAAEVASEHSVRCWRVESGADSAVQKTAGLSAGADDGYRACCSAQCAVSALDVAQVLLDYGSLITDSWMMVSRQICLAR